MRLAPRVFMRADIGGFAKIGRTRISAWDYITRLDTNPVGHVVMLVAGVVIGVRRKRSSEGIDPGARTDQALVAIKAGNVRVRAARAKMSEGLAATSITSSADAFFQCFKGMFHP